LKIGAPKPKVWNIRVNGARIFLFLGLDIHSHAMYCVAMLAKELVAAPAGPLVLSILPTGGIRGHALIQYV
jgi:hypothetical protein